MVAIVEKIALAEFYASIYVGVPLHASTPNSPALRNTLDLALPELYATVIVFSIKAREYFKARCKVKPNLFYIRDQTYAYEYCFRDKESGKHVEAI